MMAIVRLVALYIALIALIAIAAQDSWRLMDWYALRVLAGVRDPQPAPSIVLLDVPAYHDAADDTSRVRALRETIAEFLDRLAALPQAARPAQVILDFWFSAGDVSPATRHFDRALARVASAVDIYATVSPHESNAAEDAMERDATIYGLVTKGQTYFGSLDGPSIVSYHTCLTYDASDGVTVSVPALPVIVKDASIACPTHTRDDLNLIYLRPDEHFPSSSLRSDGSTVSAQIAGRTVILASLESDTEGHFGALSNPEVLAWAISAELSGPQPRPIVPETSLIGLVAVLAALTTLCFLALFMTARRRPLRHRLALCWIAAAGSVALTLGAFAALEAFLAHFEVVQPQVTLPALSVLIAGPLCGVWGRSAILERLRSGEVEAAEADDYDVFISYAHDDFDWVAANVYFPLSQAFLSDGRKLRIFFDRETIRVSSAWQDKIALAIKNSRFIVPVYSDVYFTRPYCVYELRRAMRKWIESGSQSDQIFPLMLGRPAIPPAFDDIQAAAVGEDPDVARTVVRRILAMLASSVTPV